MMKSNCLVIIPAYNEEKNITQVLHSIQALPVSFDIVVVNDGSADQTGILAAQANVEVINLFYNLGYGAALQTGFKYAASKNYSYVIQFDADGQHDPKDILTLYNSLVSGQWDIVIGSRFLNQASASISLPKKFAISIFRFLIWLFTKTWITDPTSGLQGLDKKVFHYYAQMGNFPEDFPDADTLIQMLFRKCKVTEIPAHIRPRNYGQSMHSGLKSLYYFVKMLVSILVVLLRAVFHKGGVSNRYFFEIDPITQRTGLHSRYYILPRQTQNQ